MNTTAFIKFLHAPTSLQDKTVYFEFLGLYLSQKKKSIALLGGIICFISAFFSILKSNKNFSDIKVKLTMFKPAMAEQHCRNDSIYQKCIERHFEI